MTKPCPFKPVDCIPARKKAGGGHLTANGHDWPLTLAQIQAHPGQPVLLELEWSVTKAARVANHLRNLVDFSHSWVIEMRGGLVYVRYDGGQP